MNELNAPSETLDDVTELRDSRLYLEDDDPEGAHVLMDRMCELVVRAVASSDPAAFEAAHIVVALLDREKQERWRRWFS